MKKLKKIKIDFIMFLCVAAILTIISSQKISSYYNDTLAYSNQTQEIVSFGKKMMGLDLFLGK